MACQNCDHTMQSLGKLEASQDIIFWCPRCGTIRRRDVKKFESDEMPKLVERSREVANSIHTNGNYFPDVRASDLDRLAHRVGFYEACMTPEQRKELHG